MALASLSRPVRSTRMDGRIHDGFKGWMAAGTCDSWCIVLSLVRGYSKCDGLDATLVEAAWKC